MKFIGAGVLSVSLLISWWGLFHHDHMRVVCFDSGRVVGGAEQRIFFDKANGDEPMKSDVTRATKGIPKECK